MKLEQLSEIELQFHVERLLSNYVECIDDDQLEDWPDYFVDDCVYKVIARENADRGLPAAAIFCDSKGMLIDRVVAHRNANVFAEHKYRHLLSNINVKSADDGLVQVQSNYVVLQTKSDGETKIYNAGKYLDQIVSTESGFKFKEKIVVFDTHRVDSLMVTLI